MSRVIAVQDFEFVWTLGLTGLGLLMVLLIHALLKYFVRQASTNAKSLLAWAQFLKWVLIVGGMGLLILTLMVPLGCPSTSSDRNRTQAFHRAISSVLGHYHDEYGEYPVPRRLGKSLKLGNQVYDVDAALMLYQVLSGDGTDAIQMVRPTTASNGQVDAEEVHHIMLADMPRDMIKLTELGYIVVDGFGHPFQYQPKGPETMNDTYDLWSFADSPPSAVTKAVKMGRESARWIKNW